MFEEHNAQYPGLSRVRINGVDYAVCETFGDWEGTSKVPMSDGNKFVSFRGKVGDIMYTEDDATHWTVLQSDISEVSDKHRYVFVAQHNSYWDMDGSELI